MMNRWWALMSLFHFHSPKAHKIVPSPSRRGGRREKKAKTLVMNRHGRSLLSLVASKSGTQSHLINKCHNHSLVRATPGSDSDTSLKSFPNSPGGFEYLKNAALCSKSTMSGMNPSLMKFNGTFIAPFSLNFQRFFRPANQKGFGDGSYTKSMNFVRGAIAEDEDGFGRLPQYQDVEKNADVVHIKIGRNNTFVTVTDSKGNKKCGASSGSLPGASRGGRYSADSTAEHVGRLSRNLGLKSVIMKVNGFTFFKKKRQAIMSWRDGFTQSRVGAENPIICVEDTTRRAHNGCRLPKRRRT